MLKIDGLLEQERKLKETRGKIESELKLNLKNWAEKTKNIGFWICFDMVTRSGKRIGLKSGKAELEGEYVDPEDDDYRRCSVNIKTLTSEDFLDIQNVLNLLAL